ncbi:unnamed protein product [Rotaria magnacalcarata]|uniref:Reverse transcriptase domain-containing protein n=2 Tax=Rotaria magnacalcarata TaxID=392030 RepID=A0A814SGX5_9BILA|nr:unnamed protein product [Rotaria magnacalcarata]CAF3842910.1 unnamed protein product [Rotaria magnacalcarata]
MSDFDICKQWKKERPTIEYQSLNLLLFNIQCLSTHIADLDFLISTYIPQICILTGVGSKIKNPPNIPFYNWICQEGTNAFGGVAIIIHNSLKTKTIVQAPNFILIELTVLSETILIGAIYVPPGSSVPFNLLETHVSKNFYIFGDYNAKHSQWRCNTNNSSGNELKSWLDEKGYQLIAPIKPTSKRSDAVIDFGITNDATRWRSETIIEGTSDHYPVYAYDRCLYQQKQTENRLAWIAQGNNIWKLVHPIFHPYSPALSGLTTNEGIIKNPQTIVDTLADHHEKHFETPTHDSGTLAHVEAIEAYTNISYLPNIPLEQISIEEVHSALKRTQNKKSTDCDGISALHLKQMPEEFIKIITIGFNKMAETGSYLKRSKHAKVICISKEGMYPTLNKLRPISLISNIGKLFEKIIHKRILKWCKEKGIYVDEQSGFTPERRLQTRILTLVEDLRLTVAACNRPALVIFVDFLSAFDRIWHLMLIRNLIKLDCPLLIIRWIFSWLQERSMSIHYGNTVSRCIKLFVGTPQGSVLAATLFLLQIHYLPQYFLNMTTHLFADDLAIMIMGSIEKKFSQNILELEVQARLAMDILSKYSYDYILPVNIDKTNALLVRSVVAPQYPVITYRMKVENFNFNRIQVSSLTLLIDLDIY